MTYFILFLKNTLSSIKSHLSCQTQRHFYFWSMPVIMETERLLLRRWNPKDKEAFALINGDPEVMRYFPKALSTAESNLLFNKIQEHFKAHGFGLYAVEHKANQKFIGFSGLHIPDFNAEFTKAFAPCIEIGWRIHKDYWNQNYATEAALAVIDYSWRNLKLPHLVSFTAKINTASICIMEKIKMQHQSAFDFFHPSLSKDSPLAEHIFYAIKNPLA